MDSAELFAVLREEIRRQCSELKLSLLYSRRLCAITDKARHRMVMVLFRANDEGLVVTIREDKAMVREVTRWAPSPEEPWTGLIVSAGQTFTPAEAVGRLRQLLEEGIENPE